MYTDSPSPLDPQIDPEQDSQQDSLIDPRMREVFERLDPAYPVPEGTLQDATSQAPNDWQAFAARVVNATGIHTVSSRTGAGRMRRPATTSRSWVGIVAVVLCMIGLTATLMYRSQSDDPATRYHTAGGQVSHVVLPGGTVMTLAPATSVAVSRTRGGDAVDVIGEAYFTVTQSSAHPFVVRTSNSVVQVLGTAFSVRRYANEARTRVVVEDGKVAVRAKQHGVVNNVPTAISARMMAQVSDSGVSVTPVSDTRTLTGWRDGMLVFTDAPVRDVVAELARCYNAVIRIEGRDLASERLVLEVAVRRQSLSEVLNGVGLAINAHVRRDKDAFVLVPGRDVATPRERKQESLPQPEKMYGR